ncbi:MCE family protein [Rhodococcus sp. SGAir0479]|uniref:MCE family protein n=1 Tax=Rhodococcus sp. SGAir0479 TaxID=2567884 RepID=UPI0010CD4268|nr:MCE family protein [Rhodococcus sp. SGAir0479]QCQ93362.1 MCE family protein [Rhodococcus sp. SGAir0479]
MFLVKIIDAVVGTWLFLVRGERRPGSGSPVLLGAVGIVALVLGLVAAVGIPKLWYVARTSPYAAELANASGLSGGDPVYVAGVPAGRVEGIELAGDHVRVAFRLDDGQPLGSRTTASVRLETVLGKRYLEVIPAGVVDESASDAAAADVIPLSRTTVPYSLDDVGRDATAVAQQLDTKSLEAMMTTLSQIMPDDPEQVARALAGISGATSAVAQNDRQIDQLLTLSRSLSELIVRQQDSLTTTLSNAQIVVRTLAVRKEVVTRLVENLRSVLDTVATTFTEREDEFSQMTADLVAVTDTLERNADDIDLILTRLPPALRAATDATGNGNWTDVTAPAAVVPDNLLCALGVMQECR